MLPPTSRTAGSIARVNSSPPTGREILRHRPFADAYEQAKAAVVERQRRQFAGQKTNTRPVIVLGTGTGSMASPSVLDVTWSTGDPPENLIDLDETAIWAKAVTFGYDAFVQFTGFGGFVGTPVGGVNRSFTVDHSYQLEFLDADLATLATVTETRTYGESYDNGTTFTTISADRTALVYDMPSIAGWAALRLTMAGSISSTNYTDTSIAITGHARVFVPYPIETQVELVQ